ncbi:hypothetical protein VHEMI09232 [[Torrubiella] hemipterigena]|uniref:Cytochrome P450 n=1 Tax=[Torrubiella] hemipterigena TaxID=1531966 RepID=A0A0A1T976_9HYPO|nr:hypothetical protein VHEMI09232 [[Torrubiella] hemipterigena]
MSLHYIANNLSEAQLSSTSAYAPAFLAGVASHQLFFRFGEWDLYAAQLIFGFIAANVGGAVALTRYCPEIELAAAVKVVPSLSSIAVGGIVSSMLVYRAFFHRLNKFPGPFLARLSNFYITWRSVSKFQLFKDVQELHRQYGDIVRIGPSEISIASPEALEKIHSNQSPCVKGPWYNVLYPVVSLQMVKDRKEHARRRRTWDLGFGAKALRNYEPRVSIYTDQLLKKVQESKDTPLDMAQWFNFYSFDVMGDLAFGKSFDMLKDGVVHDYMKVVHTNMMAIGAFTHLIWLFPIIKAIPLLNRNNELFQKWLYNHVKERRDRGSAVEDVFSWILKEHDAIENPTKKDIVDLHGDAELIVVAGSDTTAATLTCLFYELSRNQEVVEKLQAEVDEFHRDNTDINAVGLAKLEYLQACINEALRLYPPVPSGVQRMTPPQGLQINDAFIPGNTIVQVPTYTLQRDARVFPQPDEFIPERWTSKPELAPNPAAFAPFSMGRYSCVGKQLALMEIRYVTTSILHKYNLAYDSSADQASFQKGLVDGFTLALPVTPIVFSDR